MTVVEKLDKNDKLSAHTNPTGVNPYISNPLPTPNPFKPINVSETIRKDFFVKTLLFLFLIFTIKF